MEKTGNLKEGEIMQLLYKLSGEISFATEDAQQRYQKACLELCDMGCKNDLSCVATQCSSLCSINTLGNVNSDPFTGQFE